MSFHDGSTSNSDPSTTQSSQPLIPMSSVNRETIYLTWDHYRKTPELGIGCKKTKLVCLYCAKVFASGGINWFSSI